MESRALPIRYLLGGLTASLFMDDDFWLGYDTPGQQVQTKGSTGASSSAARGAPPASTRVCRSRWSTASRASTSGSRD